MPRRKRADKRRHEVNPAVRIAALSRHGWERYWGGAAEGREAWDALGAGWASGHGLLRTNLTTWPGPFWAYTSDIPLAFRALADEVGPASALRVRAMRWLLGEGRAHLRPSEGPMLEDWLATLERDPPRAPELDDADDGDEDDEADEIGDGDDPDPDPDATWENGR